MPLLFRRRLSSLHRAFENVLLEHDCYAVPHRLVIVADFLFLEGPLHMRNCSPETHGILHSSGRLWRVSRSTFVLLLHSLTVCRHDSRSELARSTLVKHAEIGGAANVNSRIPFVIHFMKLATSR
jgi:hypothetical protein